jgi:opacity protein-like surface antigen
MKRLCLIVAAASAAFVLSAPTAHAQTERRFGFVIAYPASVGLEWQAADRLAVRFDGTYRHSSVESSSTPTPFPVGLPAVIRVPVFEIRSSTSNTGAELGVSILFDLHRSDELRLYIAPRFAVLISKTEIETTITGLTPGDLAALTVPANRDTTSTTPTGGVAIGVSHNLTPRLRIFGEAGVNYSRGDLDGIAVNDITQTSFGLRSGVGAVILF